MKLREALPRGLRNRTPSFTAPFYQRVLAVPILAVSSTRLRDFTRSSSSFFCSSSVSTLSVRGVGGSFTAG